MAGCRILNGAAELIVIYASAGQKSVVGRTAQTPGNGDNAGHNPVGKMHFYPARPLGGRQVGGFAFGQSKLFGGGRVDFHQNIISF